MKQIGFLFDISGSMANSYMCLQQNLQQYKRENINQEQTRYHSVINLLEILVDEDSLKNYNFYSLAFGSQNSKQICDVVALIQEYGNLIEFLYNLEEKLKREFEQSEDEEKIMIQVQNEIVESINKQIDEENQNAQKLLDKQQQDDDKIKMNLDCHKFIYQQIENNGAPSLCSYFNLQQFRNSITQNQAFILYKIFNQRRGNFNNFVKILPEAVKERLGNNNLFTVIKHFFQSNSIKENIIKNIQSLISNNQDLVNYIHNQKKQLPYQIYQKKDTCLQQVIFEELKSQLNTDQTNIRTMKIIELKNYLKNNQSLQNISTNILEKVAYGYTPLCKTLQITTNFLFSQKDNLNIKNILFIISDGYSTDGSISYFSDILKKANVIVCSCYITSQLVLEPYKLYSDIQSNWDRGAQEMFQISSEIDNSDLTFIARHTNFKLSIKGKSRLFIQANDPNTLNQFFQFMTKVKNNTDTLLDLIGKFDIEQYVCSSNEFEPKSQNGGTCYANSISAVYCMATGRIFERNGGPLQFEKVRDKLIQKYGIDGACTKDVLRDTCKDYRLRYEKVNITEAKHALNAGRPLVAIFYLCKQQWDSFSDFYKKYPKGILENVGYNNEIERGGHAVVLIGYTENYLKFMNSWGTNFADGGFFKVKDEQVLEGMQFFDVYWTEQDLLDDEKKKYQQNSAMIINQRIQKYKDIQENIKYNCPKCNSQSFLSDYQGNIYEAICPRCYQQFKPQKLGETFISYLYGKDI